MVKEKEKISKDHDDKKEINKEKQEDDVERSKNETEKVKEENFRTLPFKRRQ